MIVRNQQEALCVAVEMERRAIRTYERALMVSTDPEVRQGLTTILADEKGHLERFGSMRQNCAMASHEEKVLIQAMAAQTLFPGGVMEMEREKGLNSLIGLYRFAAESEQDAVNTYLASAQKCTSEEVREAFRAIAQEESNHLSQLKKTLSAMEEKNA
jgi:rubrerythrin